jgi:CHAD domain-containing protein/CYTH domain-containing protein
MPASAFPPQLLDEPAPRAARIVALELLRVAGVARARLDDDDDADALHDFRVAVRRLRSWLRAVRPCMGDGVPAKRRRQLRRVARRTGGARDTQVYLAWLHDRPDLRRGRRAVGVRWLVDRLEREGEDGDASRVADAARLFDRLHEPLADALATYTITCRVDSPRPPIMAAALAPLVRDHAGSLRQRLAALRTADDDAAVHGARIAGKRLRYLLEPFAERVEGAPELVERLRTLQGLLGDVHDAHELAARVAVATDEAAAEQTRHEAGAGPDGDAGKGAEPRDGRSGDPRAGLLAVSSATRARGEERFAELAGAWLGDGADGFLADAAAVADRLAARGGGGVEIERKFLLDALPEAARSAPPREIAQGYLPGTELVERVRRVTTPDGGVRCWRTVKLGAGIARIEVEEETTPEIFDALWALTAGRRLSKRRHLVTDGALTWEIDDFDGRDLVLAEVELESEAAEVTIPDWLAPHVVREVTGEDAYVNVNLAS